jgi:hypothetical protein
MPRCSPEPTRRSGLPITASQDQSKVRPGMIMQMIWITFEKLVDKDVEWKPFTILEKKIVAFQVRFIVLAIHDHTVSAKSLEESF